MIDIVEEFGLNAGRVWKALNVRGILDETQLMEESSLRKNELFAAIGWLARENKIKKDGDCYKLDNTNLTRKIGTDAGTIWNVLTKEGNSDSKNISKMTNLDEKDTYLFSQMYLSFSS
jgi:hypothetical protein